MSDTDKDTGGLVLPTKASARNRPIQATDRSAVEATDSHFMSAALSLG